MLGQSMPKNPADRRMPGLTWLALGPRLWMSRNMECCTEHHSAPCFFLQRASRAMASSLSCTVSAGPHKNRLPGFLGKNSAASPSTLHSLALYCKNFKAACYAGARVAWKNKAKQRPLRMCGQWKEEKKFTCTWKAGDFFAWSRSLPKKPCQLCTRFLQLAQPCARICRTQLCQNLCMLSWQNRSPRHTAPCILLFWPRFLLSLSRPAPTWKLFFCCLPPSALCNLLS
ncbi:uncharacterized protein NEMAJ01_2277 [Nematocida major]|uniref:uncharacterized protein n=1 Tax=Nematocida major TaxID=1912982 RepID=UPI002007B40B|nr:uncharacterized protein NEMAJ01_2277 [Nematocida major]KAH9387381.1 hypothetical protein NEMAJ01_2277 [Nematocida major]